MKVKQLAPIITVSAILIIYAIQLKNGWIYLGKQANFGDLLYVLEKISCLPDEEQLLYSERTENPCTGYIYGSILLSVIKLFGITKSLLQIFGIFLLFTNLYIILRSIYSGFNHRTNYLYFLILFSPPIVLLFQRGNIDALILLMVSISAFLINKSKYEIAIFVMIIASLFKFYPFILSFVLIIYYLKGVKKYILFCGWILTGLLIFKDLNQLPFLPWDAANMFGNLIWGEYLIYLFKGSNSHSNVFLSSTLGVVIISAAWVYSKKLGLLQIERSVYFNSKFFNPFLIYVSIFLTCYFSGLSVDYRLIFLFLSVIYFNKIYTINRFGYIIYILALLVAFFFSYNSGKFQPLGDFALIFLVIVFTETLRLEIKLYRKHFEN